LAQAQQTLMRGYMDVQIDDGRIRDWKLLYAVLKGDKIMLWRDELDEVCSWPIQRFEIRCLWHEPAAAARENALRDAHGQ
jgi:hypothetical protein